MIVTLYKGVLGVGVVVLVWLRGLTWWVHRRGFLPLDICKLYDTPSCFVSFRLQVGGNSPLQAEGR